MEESKKEGVGLQVISNGILQAVHHYILAVQIEKKCERSVALQEASGLLERVKKLVDDELREATDGPKEDINISEEDSKD